MPNRDDLYPVFRQMPKWLILTIVVVSFPVYTGVMMWVGFKDGVEAWVGEIKEVDAL